ncbi:LacI family DNA-binding transcriptional regulator [Paenibacillus validus]|uniref:Substrate-binding domain-containing protein n=1 Tax=Paenibacillus validus TaxID=44253 RepID=A0A7X3CTE1_9BACL|nr:MULTISPECIES: LacI family DNA-binding transcriptional regulator [Paenibacillus]MED4599137.1 LacI family DNA-binding transcriptional regulator [Paenibacillus validus]MED4605420.1 LacI family DNA-binding transcriptional regulator [Paenibacillus validus]MUG72337.1 substrate-binding domain-containing protein [Paenibacillus validus]
MKQERGSRVTLQQVADHAGVSRATASLIVRGSNLVAERTRKKVLESMKELGYVYDRVAANLRSRNSSTVGLIITEIGNPFFSELLVGVHQELDTKGYTVILGTTFESAEKQDQLLSKMLEYRVGGVIMSPVSGSSPAVIDRLKQWDIPVVLVTKEPANSNSDYVGIDNVLGGKLAVDYLIEKGHRRIAFLGGPSESSARMDRQRGYIRALQQAGLPFDDSLVVTSAATRQGGREALQQVLNQPNPPTAVFCYNDVVAFGVMLGLKEAGLMPGRDLAVVGYDNIEEAAMTSPALTTVMASPILVGTNAANLLHKRIMGNEDHVQRIILKPELVIRESCSM